MNIVCNIVVMIFISPVYIQSKTEVSGIILKKSVDNYLVDFSKEAKDKGYDGDYSKKLVKKEDCVK